MKIIEIQFKLIDQEHPTNSLQASSRYALTGMTGTLDREPILAYAARKEAAKFWNSIVLMGHLEET